jgi:hypothetical protein
VPGAACARFAGQGEDLRQSFASRRFAACDPLRCPVEGDGREAFDIRLDID